MHYLFESVFVGLYSLMIFILVNQFITNIYLKLYIVGFIKHYASGYLNIHNYYCNYGYACRSSNDCKNGNCTSNKKYLFFESLFEGILFLVVGYVLFELPYNLKNIYVYFLIGFILHTLFEIFGGHYIYCKHFCIPN